MKKKLKANTSPSGGTKVDATSPLPPDLSVDDWRNWCFDKAKVDNAELVACCYWEYARQSASIRDAVEIAKTAVASQGIPKPDSEEREVFRAAADKAFGMLHCIGYDIMFWVGLPFPKPWQSVDKTECRKWANVRPKIPPPVKFPPFQVTGDLCIAGALHGEAKTVHEARELRNTLSEQTKLTTPVAVRGEGGVDSFIAQINWRDYDDKQIVACFKQWVKASGTSPADPRTNTLVGRRSDKGRDMGEWRTKLERLGLLRLRSRYGLDATLAKLANLPPAQRKKSKFVEPSECNREAEQAVADFQALFPFLDPFEMPLSWPMK